MHTLLNECGVPGTDIANAHANLGVWTPGWGQLVNYLVFRCYSPIELVITNPLGNAIDITNSQIPGASYIETDLDGDTDPDYVVSIPDPKPGDYHITVLPKSTALPTDTYSLTIDMGGKFIVLAQDVQIQDIPTIPYVYTYQEMLQRAGARVPLIASARDYGHRHSWTVLFIQRTREQ